jgi:DNA modification methylase
VKPHPFETHSRVIKTDLGLHSIRQPGATSLVGTGSLIPSPRNARTHSKKQVRQISNSILQFGWTCPILADEEGNIIAGHGRYLAALELGLKEVPVAVLNGLTAVQKRALALADNKIAANAGTDRKILAAELGELAVLLPDINLDISITGFEAAEIDGLMGDLVDSERDPADELPQIANKPVSKLDDLWQLGQHRLFCGDSCEEPAVRALMDRDQAAMIFADPPFNVRIKATVGRGKIKHPEFAQGSGEMSDVEFVVFLKKWMRLAAQFSEEGSIHFICMDWRHLGQTLASGEGVYTEFKNLVVWAKTTAGMGSFYRSQHEFIFVFKNGVGPHQNNIELGRHGRNRSNVWSHAGVNTFRAGRLEELSIHPTVKPVALVADAMRDCSRRGQIVFDPFMGSGTTILAAEKVGRRAYGLEIDPLYIDAAVKRWQDFTKRDAILKATGQPFDEVATARLTPTIRRVR